MERKEAINVKYFHVFGSTTYTLAYREQRRYLDPKSYEGTFLGYSLNIRAYHVFNNQTKSIMESIYVIVNDIQFEVIIH